MAPTGCPAPEHAVRIAIALLGGSRERALSEYFTLAARSDLAETVAGGVRALLETVDRFTEASLRLGYASDARLSTRC